MVGLRGETKKLHSMTLILGWYCLFSSNREPPPPSPEAEGLRLAPKSAVNMF